MRRNLWAATATLAAGAGARPASAPTCHPQPHNPFLPQPPPPPHRFKPLDMVRMAPRPGTRFAIDAEFVASSPPESRAVERGGGGGGGPDSVLGAVGPLAMLSASAHHHGGTVDLVQLKQSRCGAGAEHAERGDDWMRSVEGGACVAGWRGGGDGVGRDGTVQGGLLDSVA